MARTVCAADLLVGAASRPAQLDRDVLDPHSRTAVEDAPHDAAFAGGRCGLLGEGRRRGERGEQRDDEGSDRGHRRCLRAGRERASTFV
jgi:hypothetical protein